MFDLKNKLTTMIYMRLNTVNICLVLTLAGGQVSADPSEQTDGWFCEEGKQNKEWLCIQSKTVAADTARAPTDTQDTLTAEKRDVLPIKNLLEDAEPVQKVTLKPKPVERTSAASTTATTSVPIAQVHSNLPLYLQLAYKPGQAITISELPPEFYVVQVLSLSNKSNLEAYFSKQKLLGLSAARIESNGEILYVLLLGVYENLANATRAAENMPAQLNETKPWVRRLGSLQAAMVRADDITGSRDY